MLSMCAMIFWSNVSICVLAVRSAPFNVKAAELSKFSGLDDLNVLDLALNYVRNLLGHVFFEVCIMHLH